MRITATQIIKNVNLTTTQEAIRRIITVAPLGERGFGVPADGNDGEILAKDGVIPFATKWIPNTGGGGGIPDAPNNANAYVRKGLAWVIGYTKDAIDSLISNFQTASQVQTIADAKVSDEAYNSITWNGVAGVAPSKGKLRDKFVAIELSISAKQNQATYDVSQPTIALISDTGEIVFADTNDFPTPSELTNVKGVTAPIQGQIDGKQDTLTSTNFGAFANSLTAKNTLVDVDEVVSDDSADSSKAKKTSWLNVWLNFIKVKADLLYQPLNSILTNTTASFTTVYETKLGKYPSTATNGKILQGNGTNYVEVDAPTGGTTTSGAYTGTIVVTGTTAPTGATNHSFSFTQVDKLVSLRINLDSATSGTGITAMACELPSGAPTPALPTAVGATGDVLFYGAGTITANRALVGGMGVCGLRLKSTSPDVFEIVVSRTSGTYQKAYLSINYFCV